MTRQFHTWHWISSAVCLVGMVLFAATGITLNHAGGIAADPVIVTREATVPASVLRGLAAGPATPAATAPPLVSHWLAEELGVDVTGRPGDWSAGELYIALPRPGGDGWVAIDRATGNVTYEATDRGWIAYLNDLHKGRDTGPAWAWFIDIFAGACIVFCLTGFLLLQLHARKRPLTWPLVGAGVAIPVLLLLIMH